MTPAARSTVLRSPRRSRRWLLVLVPALTLLLWLDDGDAATTKGSSAGAAPATLVFDHSGQGAFYDLPFPSDHRRAADGRLDLTGFPNPNGVGFVHLALQACAERCRGFAPGGTVAFRFDGELPALRDDPLASVRPDAEVFLVDVDPWSPEYLQRHPVHLSVTAKADQIRPAQLLQLLPVVGRWLLPSTTYAAVVRRRLGGVTLGQPPALVALLEGRHPHGGDWALGEKLRRAYAPLTHALPALGLGVDDVAAATVFTTDDPVSRLTAQVQQAWRATPPRVIELKLREQRNGYSVLIGKVEMPLYQDGSPPYLLFGGHQVVDAQGTPVPQGHAEAEFQISIPHGPMPAAGYPLYFYVHGTGGQAAQLADRGYRTSYDADSKPGTTQAAVAASQGWAVASVDGPYSPNRIGLRAADGYLAYNFFRPAVMRDNLVQMMLEQAHFLKLVESLRIDPALVPQADASAVVDGALRFDPDLMVVGGQSLGSYLSGMLAATLDRFKGAILTGAGGSWIEFAFGPKKPLDLQALLEWLTLGDDDRFDRFHPFLGLYEMAAGEADNINYLPNILRRPRFGWTPPHMLVIEGHVDLQVPTNLQRALVLALGVDMLGSDVGASPAERLEPVLPWAGLRQLQGQVGGNILLPNGEPRTAGVVRYPEDGILEGHYVAYQYDQARVQIREFLGALKRGEVPVVRDFSADFAAEKQP